jgi:hypothetical protein
VLPREHWTLKQATRAGCSCCGPDPYEQNEEMDSDEELIAVDRVTNSTTIDMTVPAAFAAGFRVNGAPAKTAQMSLPVNSPTAPKASGYVDGKLGFAFDPSRFST